MIKFLGEFSDKELGISQARKKGLEEKYKVRRASRGIVLNSKKEVMMLFSKAFDYYQLVGGGWDKGEDAFKALVREVKDETGYKVKPEKVIGVICEFRNYPGHDLMQFSYGVTARIVSETGKIRRTIKEEGEDLEIVFLKPIECVKVFEKSLKKIKGKVDARIYTVKFKMYRDLQIMKEYLDL